jgi:NAD(P)-dependent dehydrogenase (short-subunit alcohol dehydrogenase family)
MQSNFRALPPGLLEGKVTIITGASQGIGRTAALLFAGAGAKLLIAARRGAVIEELAREIRDSGGEVIAQETDVTDDASVKAMVQAALDAYGRLDCAFNNAGIDPPTVAPLADLPLDEFERVHAVKVTGTFLCMKHQITAMLENGGGSIVNQGSVVAARGMPHYSSAGSSQAAIGGMVRSAAAAYGPRNIRINLLETGAIMTEERLSRIPADRSEAVASNIRGYVPLGRGGRSEEVAAQAAWLLSDWSSYVSGVSLPVDGGSLAGTPL